MVMTLRVIEDMACQELKRRIPELYVSLADPDDDGGNVTSALGEIRLWLVPPIYTEDGASRTLELVVRVGNPLIRNSGKFKGGLDYVDEVIGTLNGFAYDTGKSWGVRRVTYWKRVGTMHWYEVRAVSSESAAAEAVSNEL